MKYDYDNLNEGARSKKRAKRRKTNLILNSLIVVVILLIVIVSANIFFGNNDEGADDSNVAAENEKASAGKKDDNGEEANQQDSKATDEESNETSEDGSDEESESDNPNEESDDSEDLGEPVVTEGGSDANVKQTIEYPDWKPVGTTQAGEHKTVFDENSVDWHEMLLAYSYATGIDKDNMTVWWNQNNGATNAAVGTISEKGSNQTFRVAIEWVEGEGWKPVKVEELIENDKRR